MGDWEGLAKAHGHRQECDEGQIGVGGLGGGKKGRPGNG